jgi:hypothetical protein
MMDSATLKRTAQREEGMATSEDVKTSDGKGYLKFADGSLIPLDPLPKGQFIVHNNARGCSFRIWVQDRVSEMDRLIRCRCDLGSKLEAAEIPIHYRYPKRAYSVWVAG